MFQLPRLTKSSRIWLRATTVSVLALLAMVVARGDSAQPPPYDFSDQYYLENGINPDKILNRIGSSGNPCLPGGANCVTDSYNTDPHRGNNRVLQTTGGFNNSGNLIYYSIMGFLTPDSFSNDAAGQKAKEIANSYRAFIFPKQPNQTSTICSPTVTSNCVKLSPAVSNRRQDNLFDTRNGYFSNNPLGLWVLAFVVYTPQAYTPEGQAALKPFADTNGVTLDGTPILTAADDIDGLAAKNLVSLVTRPLDGSQGFPWVI